MASARACGKSRWSFLNCLESSQNREDGGNDLGSVCATWRACQFSTHVRRNCVMVIVAVFVASVRERPPVMSWSINHCGGASDAMSLIVRCSCDREEIQVLVRTSKVV